MGVGPHDRESAEDVVPRCGSVQPTGDGTVTAGSLASYQVAVGLSGAGQRVDGVFGPIVKVAVRGWARDLGAGDHSGDYLAVVVGVDDVEADRDHDSVVPACVIASCSASSGLSASTTVANQVSPVVWPPISTKGTSPATTPTTISSVSSSPW